MNAPDAEIVHTLGKQVTVLCPYCGQTHTHNVLNLGHTEHHAPGALTRQP